MSRVNKKVAYDAAVKVVKGATYPEVMNDIYGDFYSPSDYRHTVKEIKQYEEKAKLDVYAKELLVEHRAS